MNAINDQFAFDAVMRQSAAVAMLKLRHVDQARADLTTSRPAMPTNIIPFAVIAGLIFVSVIVFATGYAALLSETPAVWIHRLMALTVAQSILTAALAMKLLPLIERRNTSVQLNTAGTPRHVSPSKAYKAIADELEVPAPKAPIIGGQLAGREFLEYPDGSIEIDTLVGRRRFISIEAAREFVGA